jgi:hypothetical protein
MTAPKTIAASLTTLLDNPLVQIILDRSADITPIINEVQSWWGYDLMNRKPSPAYDEYGIFRGTDLDLACFLYALAGRGAVLNIPWYESHTQAKIREDQQLLSKANRHGKLIGVGANKDFWSFNITIFDENVIGEDEVGDFRTFSLTDKTGEWYKGWNRIEFVPTIKENRFITENKLWTGNRVIFKNFIHPNRWTSVFGHHYVITRLLMDRLTDEAAFLNTETKRIQATGIEYPEGEGPRQFDLTYGKLKREKFTAFEMKVYMPKTKIQNDYTLLDETQENLVHAYRTRKSYTYKIIPALRFMTRASEYAHFQAPDRFPHWMKGAKWEDGFKVPRGRTIYKRLKLFQDKVGEHSISLLKRTYQKAATVSSD